MERSRALAQVRPLTPPTATLSDQALTDARRLFARTLSAWASDLLVVRAAGLRGFTWSAEHAEHRWSRAA